MATISEYEKQLYRDAVASDSLQQLRIIHWRCMHELLEKYPVKANVLEIPDPHTGVLVTFTSFQTFSDWCWQLVCRNHY
jgi:hypothetical protein